MIQYIAHAGEMHETTTQSAAHTLGSWYIAIPLVTLITLAFGVLLFGVLGMLANDAKEDKRDKEK